MSLTVDQQIARLLTLAEFSPLEHRWARELPLVYLADRLRERHAARMARLGHSARRATPGLTTAILAAQALGPRPEPRPPRS